MKLTTKKQEWRPIEGFPTYEVSNWGRVRRWYDVTEKNEALRAELGRPLLRDAEGLKDIFPHNLAIHGQNKTVTLEREKGSGKYVVRKVADLQLAAFPPEIMAA